ncbi:hypothetical protein K1719_027654 [Acacia pycnantha]|nr:hypothetical protein K1719_027654 [Acacia pycnantha]
MDCYLYWNTRGACGKGLLRNLKLLCNGPKPSILLLAETRIEDGARLKSLNSLGYDMVRVVPSVGNSGGLAVAWISSKISVVVLEENRQFLHLRCQVAQEPSFLLTSIYAIPHSDLRSVLWGNLLRIAGGVVTPWAIIGDFNDISTANERIGGRGVFLLLKNQLQQCIQMSQVDLCLGQILNKDG